MRIELPADGDWAVTRAHEDAHTLTLAAPRPPMPAAPLSQQDELLTIRVTAHLPRPVALTLTF
jgi:hypothetical protein